MELNKPRPGYPFGYQILAQGSGSAGARGSKPPRFSELVEAAGPTHAASARFGLSPSTHRPVPKKLAAARPDAIDMGSRTWGNHRGHVVLTRSTAGQFANLIAFTWTDRDHTDLVGIGAWTPLKHAVATLHTIISAGAIQPVPSAPTSAAPVDGVSMVESPQWLSLLCRSMIAQPCPREIPRPASSFTIVQVGPYANGRSTTTTPTRLIDAAWGGATGRTGLDRPPRLVHLILSNGDRPSRATPTDTNLATLLRHGYPPRPILLGHPTWAGHDGTLSLGDCFGDHLCYRWTSKGTTDLVSIHAYDPLTQTISVLRAIVTSTTTTSP
jgi:hypothetical protein